MLAAVVLLIAAAACLVGVCALLLSATQARAFHADVERAQPDDVDVTAFLVDLPGSELEDARSQAQDVVTDVLAPMRPTVSASAVGAMRQLDGDRVAYLGTDDDLAGRAVLTSGRLPEDTRAARPEAVVPASAARQLGLHLGDTVTLDRELGLSGVTSVAKPVTIVVVGTFDARPGGGWETDPLTGQGVGTWTHGSASAAAYGPFLVGDAAFRSTASYVTGLRVTGHPTLALAQRSTLADASQGLGRASALLTDGVGDDVQITRVGSNLTGTLDRIEAQQATTRSTVLVVVLLGAALAFAAALLAGWLVASRRDDERALLVALGLSRRQQVTAALTEAGLLAAAAAALAVPAAALTHSLLTHAPDLRAAGLTQGPTVTVALVAGVLVTSFLLALALVLTALDTGTATDRGARHRAAVRGGLDVLVAVVAVACWLQLRSRPATTGSGDLVLTVAPVLCLAAVTVLAVRLVPIALGAAARVGARSRGLVLPLAAQQAARRPHTGTAMVAIAAAVAAGTFGLGLHTTWERSQDDQAALLLGTDLSLVPGATAGQRATTAVESATERGTLGATVSPVIDRPLTLGSYVGQKGEPPVLVAVDTTHAGTLLRGRLDDGRSWGQIGAGLAPSAPVQGIPLPADGAGIEARGQAPSRAALRMTVTAVLQDAAGIRSSVDAVPLPMDGRTHPVSWLGPISSEQALVGVRLDLDGPGAPTTADLSVSLRVPGPAAPAGTAWTAMPPGDNSVLSRTDATVEPDGSGTVITATANADLTYFGYASNTLLATGIPVAPDVPVAVSQDLVDDLDAPVGSRLTASLDATTVTLRVVDVVPDVPSAPGRPAVLADGDLLTRALVDAGDLDPGYDAWWIADTSPASVRAAERLGVGEVTSRSEVAAQLATGPLRVGVPTALLTLVVVATLMLLLSVGLLLASDRHRRSAEVSRLRALGMSARDARRLLLAENAAFLLPLVVVGALVGRAMSGVLGPLLIRSDLGGAPVPPAVEAWPWGAEALLVGGSVVGALAIAAALTAAHVRRASPARLHAGEAG
ncbi:ABC transporter permease [Nocardioides hankookensis]